MENMMTLEGLEAQDLISVTYICYTASHPDVYFASILDDVNLLEDQVSFTTQINHYGQERAVDEIGIISEAEYTRLLQAERVWWAEHRRAGGNYSQKVAAAHAITIALGR
ncbi:hypothetical protein JCM5353_002203 [Sporobolomyces roseus]